jgi:cytoskeleton protein RodZ
MFDIGSTLRQARERRGLDLQDIAEATRIRAKYLAALENEQLAQLPEDVYARAFMRTYADFLGLEGEVYVAELSSRLEASKPPPPPLPPEPRFTLPRLDRRTATVLAAVAAVPLIVLAAWRSGGSQEPLPATNVDVGATTRAPVPRQAPPKRIATPASGRLLLAAAHGDCWLSVRVGSRDGRVLYEGMLRRGEEVRVFGARFWIRIGAPWNLEARWNRRALRGLPAGTGNVVVARGGIVPA